MSTISEQVNQIKNWWQQGEGAIINTEIEACDTRITELKHSISDLSGLKAGYNPLNFLKNAWVKATEIPPLQKEVSEQQSLRGEKVSFLTKTAESHANDILASVLKGDESVVKAQINEVICERNVEGQTKSALSVIKKNTDSVIGVINRAWKECDEAQGYETFDMVASNPLATLVSHSETKEAAQHLEKVSKALQEYKTFMEQARESYKDANVKIDVEELTNIAEWDLWLGVLDIDVLSFFSSWENHEKLGKAKKQLEEMLETIQPVSDNVKNEIDDLGARVDKLNRQYVGLRAQAISGIGVPELMQDVINGKYNENTVSSVQNGAIVKPNI